MNVLQTQASPELVAAQAAQANITGATMASFGVGQPSVTLTIRLIMQGKEVGSIIGKKGDNIKRFREESGAKITISDGSCPERIVTVTGSTDAILKAFALIARKFEEVSSVGGWLDLDPNCGGMMQSHSTLSLTSIGTNGGGGSSSNGKNSSGLGNSAAVNSMMAGQAPVTLKLIVPASQCGSLIGKGGAKIKEIRESTGASIQVASEMLPNSTERAVTLSGTAEAITKSIYQICCVMLESPPKGPTIPYRPKPAMPPVFFAGGQAYTIQGQFAIPHPDLTKLHRLALQHAPLLPGQAGGVGAGGVGSLSPQATLATLANSAAAAASMGHAAAAAAAGLGAAAAANNVAAAAAASSSASAGGVAVPNLTTEMTIPNDIIGSVIGKGGAKINEIRQLSGATIKINNSEEGTKDRVVLISGTPEAINLAQYLIATRMLPNNCSPTADTPPSCSAADAALENNTSNPSEQIVVNNNNANSSSEQNSSSSNSSSNSSNGGGQQLHHHHPYHPHHPQQAIPNQMQQHQQQQQQQYAMMYKPYNVQQQQQQSYANNGVVHHHQAPQSSVAPVVATTTYYHNGGGGGGGDGYSYHHHQQQHGHHLHGHQSEEKRHCWSHC